MRPLTPAQIADDAIGLFLEYRDNYGCDESQARGKAIVEVVEATEALGNLLHDYPERVVVSLSEDEIISLMELCDEKIYTRSPVPQETRERYEGTRKSLKAAQLEAAAQRLRENVSG